MSRLPLLLVVLAGCAGAPTGPSSGPLPSACEPSSDVPPGRIARVTVTPEAAGTWLVEYAFAEPESALLFGRSTGDYRRESWTPLDDGVRLRREGGFDVVRLDAASRSARFRVTPYTLHIPGDYDPALVFSDGGRAVYVDQFRLVRVPDAETVAAQPGDGFWQGERPPFAFVLDTEAPIVAAGERLDGPVCFDSEGPVGYVYYGPGDVIDGPSYIGVVDPELPAWIRSTFDADLGTFFRALEGGFGSPLPQRASVLFAYGGRDAPGFSNTGGVLPGQTLLLNVRGAGNDTASVVNRAKMRGLIAHEATHLFQYRNGRVPVAEGWVHEGHARAAEFRLVPENTVTMERHATTCREALEGGRPLATVINDDDGGWACASWVWLLADRLAPDADLFTLWDRMAEAAAGSPAGAEHIVSALRAAGADGPNFEALRRSLGGEGGVDTVTLLDPKPVRG